MLHFRFRSIDCRSLIAVGCLIGLVGCSGSDKLNPVTGTVHHKDKPLAGALVTFHPKGPVDFKSIPSTGLTKDDGTFSLTTGDKAGAPAGEYLVTIICSETVAGKPGVISTGPPDSKDRLNGAYANKDASKIAVIVKPGENRLDPFQLK